MESSLTEKHGLAASPHGNGDFRRGSSNQVNSIYQSCVLTVSKNRAVYTAGEQGALSGGALVEKQNAGRLPGSCTAAGQFAGTPVSTAVSYARLPQKETRRDLCSAALAFENI